MADVNFFDMSQEEYLAYKQNPDNFHQAPTNLDGNVDLGVGYFVTNPYDHMPSKETVVEHSFFDKPEMVEPELWDNGRIIVKENIKIQKEKVRNQMREAQENLDFDPLNLLVERTPEALAKDTRIQQLLSEAETMVRRYNLPASAAETLKTDIMKAHLPDFISRKDAVSQKQKDEIMDQIMRSIDPEHNVSNTHNNVPIDNSKKDYDDEDEDEQGGGAAPVVPSPATSGGTRDPPAAGAGGVGGAAGGDLAVAVEPSDEVKEQARELVEEMANTLVNGTEKNIKAVEDFIDVFRGRGAGSAANSIILGKMKRKKGSKLLLKDKGYNNYFRGLFNLGETITDKDKQNVKNVVGAMTPFIDEYFE